MHRSSIGTYARYSITLAGAAALVSSCGSSDDGASSSGGSAGSAGSTGCADCRTPPAPPANGVSGDGAGVVLAISQLYLGDTRRDGTPDASAWKQFGYDLDGIKSTQKTAEHCKPAGDATDATVKTDGDGGIDNSFGLNLMPILDGLAPGVSTTINESLAEGSFAMLLEVEKLGSGTDYVGLPAAVYFGAQLGHAPAWDGSDAWPVFCELMQDCQASGTKQIADGNTSRVKFPASYVASRTWVSGSKTSITLTLSVQGSSFTIDIGQAILTADLESGNPASGATNGIIAGVIDTEQLVGTLAQVSGRLSTSLCEGPTLESVKNNVRAASDLMKDGTQDPDATCDGISIGIGFEMKPAKLGDVLDAVEPTPDPCAGS
jgi:hypothetical protein